MEKLENIVKQTKLNEPANQRHRATVDKICSGKKCISPIYFEELTEFFNNLAFQHYHAAMHSINESLTELTKYNDLLIPFDKPCPPEVEIFDSRESEHDGAETLANDEDEGEFCCPHFQVIDVMHEKRPENTWTGTFEGFDLCNGLHHFCIDENRKCVELLITGCDMDYVQMLRNGIRCFLIDLFVGTEVENLHLIQRLKEAQVSLTKELNFPVCTTLVAKLSPRHQYTGYLKPFDAVFKLNLRDPIVITTDRYYSTRGSAYRIYVNARFLLSTLRVCDVLAIGQNLQLQVRGISDHNVYCFVSRAGELRSRMPVLFPNSCQRYRLSWEEIEGLAFARAVGINVVISYIHGTPAYVEDLKIAMSLLDCENMQLFARVVLNEIKGCAYDMQWVIENYDGFLLDTCVPNTGLHKPQLLHMCPNAVCFLEAAFKRRMPMIMDHVNIAKRRLVIPEENQVHIFHYPDKYLVKCDATQRYFYFNFLQQRISKEYTFDMLSRQPYCDYSYTGSDALARGCCAASIEMQAKVIVITDAQASMAIKISHFRPLCPIILVTRTKCLMEFVMVHHNIIKLLIPLLENEPHKKLTFKELVYGLKFALSLDLVKSGDNVLLVYGMHSGTKFPDKYVGYTFDEESYVVQLKNTLFD